MTDPTPTQDTITARLLPACTCGELTMGRGHDERCPTLASPIDSKGREKRAPVQGYTPGIPWAMHLRAYDAYRAKWGHQAAMIDIEQRGCRGGFSTGELDDFIPGWRDELSEIAALLSYLATLKAELEEARGQVEHAFKEAYQLGFLEGYECEPRYYLYKGGVAAAMECCHGTSEAWSDYRANHLTKEPTNGR